MKHFPNLFRCLVTLAVIVLIAACADPSFAQKKKRGKKKKKRPTASQEVGVNEYHSFITVRGVPKEEENRVRNHKKLSKEEFLELINSENVHVVTDATIAKSMKNIEAAQQKMEAQVKKDYAEKKHLLDALPKERGAIPVKIKASRGELDIQLLGRDNMVQDMYLSSLAAKDKETQLRILTVLHKNVDRLAKKNRKKNKAMLVKLKKYSPRKYKTKKVGDIQSAIIIVADFWSDLFPGLGTGSGTPPGGYPGSCDQEEGAGEGSDRDGCSSASGTFSSNGLYLQHNWPLKYYTTCVKNQATRGTCTAFGTCAAVESRIAAQHGRWMNLSEQDLYKMQRGNWSFWLDNYGDGYVPTASFLFQLTSGYYFPLEESWNYNPSCSRDEDDDTRTYTDSCLNYNEDCSDTNHQAHRDCYTVEDTIVEEVLETVSTWVSDIASWFGLGQWVEETVTTFVETVVTYEVCVFNTDIPGTSGFRVTPGSGAIPFYYGFLGGSDGGVSQAKSFLDNEIPIVYCFNVVDSFRDVDSNGFVSYLGTDEDAEGGHCMMLTGYCDNDDLPAGVAAGAGGGYLIVKNSWGTSWGDAGYVYLPYDWARAWTTSMVAVTSVN